MPSSAVVTRAGSTLEFRGLSRDARSTRSINATGSPSARRKSASFRAICPVVALVIKARQMQDSVQHQDFDFLGGRMA